MDLEEGNGEIEDIELCDFYENYDRDGSDSLLTGVHSLDDLKMFGRRKKWCPYFLARHLINFANVVVFSYQYVVDPKISEIITKEFKENSILVLDEAHNIDNVCIDALSIVLDQNTLDASSKDLANLKKSINELKAKDAQKLRDEYNQLVNGLATTPISNVTDLLPADPVLSEDVMKEVVPGNIRRGEHFLSLLRRLVEYIRTRLHSRQAELESPLSFLRGCLNVAQIPPKSLKFCSGRLASLLHTLEVTDISEYHAIGIICDFATLVGTYSKGFVVIIEPYSMKSGAFSPVLQFACLDASIAMKPIVHRYQSVIITSGTLSPLDMYPRILNIKAVVSESLPMSLNRACLCPLVITRGGDQVAVSTQYDCRNDPSVVRNYGNLLISFSSIVPDGIVVFFPSYKYMFEIVSVWNEMKLLSKVLENKLLFVETTDSVESSIALSNYQKACDSGRGAILFSVARGKISEGIDFDHHYGLLLLFVFY